MGGGIARLAAPPRRLLSEARLFSLTGKRAEDERHQGRPRGERAPPTHTHTPHRCDTGGTQRATTRESVRRRRELPGLSIPPRGVHRKAMRVCVCVCCAIEPQRSASRNKNEVREKRKMGKRRPHRDERSTAGGGQARRGRCTTDATDRDRDRGRGGGGGGTEGGKSAQHVKEAHRARGGGHRRQLEANQCASSHGGGETNRREGGAGNEGWKAPLRAHVHRGEGGRHASARNGEEEERGSTRTKKRGSELQEAPTRAGSGNEMRRGGGESGTRQEETGAGGASGRARCAVSAVSSLQGELLSGREPCDFTRCASRSSLPCRCSTPCGWQVRAPPPGVRDEGDTQD